MPIEDIYKKVGYFYQEPLVFDASLTENITFTSPVSPAKVTQALHLCALDHLSPDTII
jgi:ABC-type transport system involved in cytochrome bd biosynthesis fused ATPase/permease subunit